MIVFKKDRFTILVYHVQNQIYNWHIETKSTTGQRMCLFSGQVVGESKALKNANKKLTELISEIIEK